VVVDIQAFTTATTTPPPECIDPAILGLASSMGLSSDCLLPACEAAAFGCALDEACAGAAAALLQGEPSLDDQVRIAWALADLLASSAATAALARCVDGACGTAIATASCGVWRTTPTTTLAAAPDGTTTADAGAISEALAGGASNASANATAGASTKPAGTPDPDQIQIDLASSARRAGRLQEAAARVLLSLAVAASAW